MAREAAVDRSKCTDYFSKGKQYYGQAQIALENGATSVAASNALHAAILFIDALNIAELGLRSNSGSHTEAAALFKRVTIKDAQLAMEKDSIATIFLRILQQKNVAEYTEEDISKGDTEKIMHNVEKIMKFVKAELEGRKYL